MHVPGWHDLTKDLQDDGTIQMLGIVQEQHPDRARLFMQWKEMGWPVLVDSYNLLEITEVPVTLAIDENGIIRERLRSPQRSGGLSASFLEAVPVGAEAAGPAATAPDIEALGRIAESQDSTEAWKTYADALAVWGGPGGVDQAIAAYEEVARRDPEDGVSRFRLGVAYRMRYDSEVRQDGDFQRAVSEWSRALAIDPNQYIWRRRIQQYGPRLDKPYPFYDWVPMAREELIVRGEQPVSLVVEPRGSEFASPQTRFTAADTTADPDPLGRVLRDENQFINVEVVSVPPRIAPGDVARVHLVFRPIEETLAHWNNEAEEMVVWVDPPEDWAVDGRVFTHPIPPEVATKETRTIEVEVRAPDASNGGGVSIPAYALYYVCEDVNGVCMYRRQDLELALQVSP